MQKLIKLDNEYYIVDDGELETGKWCINPYNIPEVFGHDFAAVYTKEQIAKCKRITYTTDVLRGVNLLLRSTVDRLVDGYSLYEMAYTSFSNTHDYIEGFKAHKDLSKDKMFTFDDLAHAMTYALASYQTVQQPEAKIIAVYLRSRLPKTEWLVEFDKNNKLVLI